MKTRRSPLPPDSAPATDVSPMVDVCFLLLIFFVTTASLTPRERDLGLAVGKNEAGMPAMPVEIRLNGNGTVRWGAESGAVDDGELAKRLRLAKAGAAPAELAVSLDLSDDAPQQRVIDVLDHLAAEKIVRVALLENR